MRPLLGSKVETAPLFEPRSGAHFRISNSILSLNLATHFDLHTTTWRPTPHATHSTSRGCASLDHGASPPQRTARPPSPLSCSVTRRRAPLHSAASSRWHWARERRSRPSRGSRRSQPSKAYHKDSSQPSAQRSQRWCASSLPRCTPGSSR